MTAETTAVAEPESGVPELPPVSPFRLVATLAVSGALAGLLLVIAFQLTQPRIQAHKAKILKDAVLEVLAGPESYETLYVVGGALTADAPTGPALLTAERVYAGRTPDGRLDGFAVPAEKAGFQDKVVLIFGYDPTTKSLRAMKVLENKETPGLGDSIEKKPEFARQFSGRTVPLVPVKTGAGSGATNEVDTITGATISSKTVIAAVNQALETMQPLMDAYAEDASR